MCNPQGTLHMVFTFAEPGHCHLLASFETFFVGDAKTVRDNILYFGSGKSKGPRGSWKPPKGYTMEGHEEQMRRGERVTEYQIQWYNLEKNGVNPLDVLRAGDEATPHRARAPSAKQRQKARAAAARQALANKRAESSADAPSSSSAP